MIRSEYGMWMELREAADVLALRETQVAEMVTHGILPAVRIEGRWLVPEAATLEMTRTADSGGMYVRSDGGDLG